MYPMSFRMTIVKLMFMESVLMIKLMTVLMNKQKPTDMQNIFII
jgi:hypothetical protein